MNTGLRFSVVAVFLLLCPAASSFASPLGFESGNFAGWNVIVPTYSTDDYGPQKVGGAFVKTTGTSWWDYAAYTPIEGRYLAELVVDNSALSTGGYVAVQNSFTLKAGDTVSGWAAYTTEDDLATDWAFARIYNDTGWSVATPWSATSGFDGFTDHGLPWSFWSWIAPVSGKYVLELRAGTGGDAQMGSSALFDAISITRGKSSLASRFAASIAVPDRTGTILLLAGGLGALGSVFCLKRFIPVKARN
jgi:hypothetical protein